MPSFSKGFSAKVQLGKQAKKEAGRVLTAYDEALRRLFINGKQLPSPPDIAELAEQSYKHPITGEPWTVGLSTIQRWYYKVRKKQARAMEMLCRAVRKDAGTHPSLTVEARAAIQQQYRDHRRWSYLLYWDNLKVRAKKHPELSRDPVVPDGPPVHALRRSDQEKRWRRPDTAGAHQAEARREQLETRSYESATVAGLFHLDFHEGSRAVLLPDGT